MKWDFWRECFVYLHAGGNLPGQFRVVDRTSGIRGLQNVDIEAALRQILGEAEGTLHTDTTYRWKQIRDQKNSSVGQGFSFGPGLRQWRIFGAILLPINPGRHRLR